MKDISLLLLTRAPLVGLDSWIVYQHLILSIWRPWIHRSGACRVLPPQMMKQHPVFSLTGQPIPVPGSMGTSSYICIGGDGEE
jgi:hypothetical protein